MFNDWKTHVFNSLKSIRDFENELNNLDSTYMYDENLEHIYLNKLNVFDEYISEYGYTILNGDIYNTKLDCWDI